MTNPPPVAPVVTDEMVEAAWKVYAASPVENGWKSAMRYALIAALETSSDNPTLEAYEAACMALWKHRDDKADLIAACDAALDWADANARAFPIETAPKNEWVEVWCSESKVWLPVFIFPLYTIGSTITHWRPNTPPPSNPPLPAPLEALGAVLRRVKGVS